MHESRTAANFYLDFVTRRGYRCIFFKNMHPLLARRRRALDRARDNEEPRLFRSSALRFSCSRSVMTLLWPCYFYRPSYFSPVFTRGKQGVPVFSLLFTGLLAAAGCSR